MDPRLHPFDPRQPLPWRIFFRRLALRFRGLTIPAVPVGPRGRLTTSDRVRSLGSLYSVTTGLAHWYIEGGFLLSRV